MNVFKLSVKVAARHWNYLLIYLAAFGAMALIGSGAIQVASPDQFQEDRPKVAVIDRDASALSSALGDYALAEAQPVTVEDGTFGLQDAAAKDLASYVLVIPEGFESELIAAAREGRDAPQLGAVVSYQSARGSLVDERVKSFARSLYGFAATDAGASAADIAARASEACRDETPVAFVPVESKGIPAAYLNFAAFSAYALFTAPSIFIAVGFAALRRLDVRRRLASGPVPSSRFGLQVLGASLVFTLAVWAVLGALGIVAVNPASGGASAFGIAVVLAAQLSFALVGCAVGFLLLQVGVSESMANGVGNIAGLVCSFFSGAWIPLSIMGEGVRLVASFTPFFWATDAMTLVAEAPDVTVALAAQAAGEVGVTVLWAVVIGVLAVALGRVRLRERGA